MRDIDEFLNTCGCCADGSEEPGHHNPPGLAELDYRLGVHGQFLARMLADLTRARIPDGEHAGQKPLLDLTTRQSDDPAIALLDAWAVAADILSFYQERIANEGYLRTATERRSLLELARAIGYELGSGVAASTYLSFLIEAAKGAPEGAAIPKGTAVQSIPAGQGELPQTFETSVNFTGYPEWNKLKPQLTQVQNISGIDTVERLHLKGIDNNLQQGDMILLTDSRGGTIKTAVRAITETDLVFDQNRTVVTLEDGASGESGTVAGGGGTVAGGESGTVASGESGTVAGGGGTTSAGAAAGAWLGMPGSMEFTGTAVRDQVYQMELSEAALQAKLGMYAWSVHDVLGHQYAPAPPPAGISVHVFRETAALFGHNAPRWESLPDPAETRGGTGNDPYEHSWDGSNARHIWETSQGGTNTPADVYLERAIKGVERDSYVAFASPSTPARPVYQIAKAQETSRVDYALSGKATALSLTDVGAGSLTRNTGLLTRETTAYVKSEELTLAELPIDSPVPKGAAAITLDSMVVGLAKDQPIALTGEQADADGVIRSEVHLIKEITHTNKRTTLEFSTELEHSYRRDSLVLNANTVPATHGETVPREVLGSGSGSARNQRFKLKKAPLTYSAASTADGTQSSLMVRVDGVLWEESPSLYALGPEDHGYVVRRDDEGNSTVLFGDGEHGARLPTGQENVIATYRSGIGSQGEVEAGSLTMLKAKPLGVKEVQNPVRASGAGDPQALEAARENAPLTVKTLDRIVSLQDFSDFSRAFAGIGKAQALPIWDGEQQTVHITVATESGGEVVDPLLTNLRHAIDRARDPVHRVELGSFQRRYFHLKASLLIDQACRWQDVEPSVQKAVRAAFAFQKRSFGQPVTAAEIVALIHDQQGVVAVDVDELHVVDEDGNPVGELLSTVLTVQTARWNTGKTAILPAELLIVNPSGIKLSRMTGK